MALRLVIYARISDLKTIPSLKEPITDHGTAGSILWFGEILFYEFFIHTFIINIKVVYVANGGVLNVLECCNLPVNLLEQIK